MKKETISFDYDVLLEHELNEEETRLITKAKDATFTSFSPYSHFSVGACILLDNGEYICGSNQESAAYTTGICAERCAMFYANAQFPGVGVKAVAIAARGIDGKFTNTPISPCGACRQVLAEVENRFHPFALYLYGTSGSYRLSPFSALLPFNFNDDSLV